MLQQWIIIKVKPTTRVRARATTTLGCRNPSLIKICPGRNEPCPFSLEERLAASTLCVSLQLFFLFRARPSLRVHFSHCSSACVFQLYWDFKILKKKICDTRIPYAALDQIIVTLKKWILNRLRNSKECCCCCRLTTHTAAAFICSYCCGLHNWFSVFENARLSSHFSKFLEC